MKLRGIIPPVVTPMTPDQEIDLPGLRQHIDFLLARGVHGIFVLGTSGEFYALDEAEKQKVVAAAVAHVNGRAPVYAGTGAETTREVVRLTKMAEHEGAVGVSVITPYFIKPNQTELADHFRRVAESTSLSVVLYNNPATCGGLSIEPETVARLAEVPNIVGIKDSSGDLQNTIEIVRSTPRETFSVLNGRDTLILAALQSGAQGAIPAACNIAPELCVGIYESFTRGDADAAKRAQSRLHGVRMAMSLGTGNSAVKEAMALLGRPAGPMRSPVLPFGEAQKAKLKAILETAGLMG
ncbi:4-hydroxy-tetrahydrodipicolinate synthase [Frigoriglobus tundricola]|uniref:4-hydroxy-tetrahydrodipicolinate synthase n=1 Tax=Frigoriglobus tundricola TaxID=2774151 RepID=A0A6M5YPC2_9BACT|nr:4-hydroxy-tetrahydrodipicolinate synthase [Frigoriglobus tundricola]QJW95133.1 4-hydroxy-tetrahydrodipicolinate synthase [Frigoriglobus tundricola]